MDLGDSSIQWIEILFQECDHMWSHFENTVEQDLDSLSCLSSSMEPPSALSSPQQQIPEVSEYKSLEMGSGEAVDKCIELLSDTEFSDTEYFEPILCLDDMDKNAEKRSYALKGEAGSDNASMQYNDDHVIIDENKLDALYGSFIIVDKDEFHGIPSTTTRQRFLQFGKIASLLKKRSSKKHECDQQATSCQIDNQSKQDESEPKLE